MAVQDSSREPLTGFLKTTLSSALDVNNDAINAIPQCSYVNLAASGIVDTGDGRIMGIVINSHTGGTLKLWDNTAGSGTVLCNTMTFAVGERYIPMHGATYGTGLYATIGGTADITILYFHNPDVV